MLHKELEGYILHMRAYAAYDMKCPIFPFSESDGKTGISRTKNVIDFEIGKGPKINMFDFVAFQNFGAYRMLHMPSFAKYIIQMLFGAFQGTPPFRTYFY